MILKRWLVGDPLKTAQARHERLSKAIALPIFSSNAISSVAYASEEILLVLVLAGAVALYEEELTKIRGVEPRERDPRFGWGVG